MHALSRAPHHPSPRLDAQVVDLVLESRDEPPEGLGRTPAPVAILYYLPQDQRLQHAGLRLPRSTRTIHRLLRDVPSALIRLCHCLGDRRGVCEPHHPQQNGFVERSHRTSQHECLALLRRATLAQVPEVTETFVTHSNWQRPHQGLSCGEMLPRVTG